MKRIQGTLFSYLETRSFDGYDTLMIGCHTVLAEAQRFPILDTLRCGDEVLAEIDDKYEATLLEVVSQQEQKHDR